jgi:DNA-binding CsgD family transcriptional regulator
VTFIRQADTLVADDGSRSPGLGRDVVRVLTLAREHVEARDFADEILRDRPASGDHPALVQLLLAPRLWATGELAELGRRARDPRAAEAAPPLRARLAAYAALAGTSSTLPGNPTLLAGNPIQLPGNPTPLAGNPSLLAGDDPADPAALAGTADAVALAVADIRRAESALAGGRYAEAAWRFRRAREAVGAASHEAGAPDPAQLEIREIAATARFDLGAAFAALASARHADSWHAIEYAWVRADLELGAGRLGPARQSAEQALNLMNDLGDHAFEARVRSVLAAVAVGRGSLGEARKQLAITQPGPGIFWWDEMLAQSAVEAHRRGDPERVAEVSQALDRIAESNPGAAGPGGAAALAHGLLTGDLERAVELLATSGRGLLLALAEEEAGRAGLTVPSDRAEAITVLERALARYEDLGSGAGAARVLQTMHRAGLRRRRRPAAESRPDSGWAALTAMERRVAVLVAEGHSNRSAAAELVLSPNTVATHLRAAYAKLGVHSRVRFAAVVNEESGPR